MGHDSCDALSFERSVTYAEAGGGCAYSIGGLCVYALDAQGFIGIFGIKLGQDALAVSLHLGGYCISRYKWFELLFSNVRLFSLLCAAAIVGWLTMTWLQHGRAVWLLCPSLVYVVVSLFYRGQVFPAIVTRTLGAWGRQSLEIYVLHVFLLHSTLIYIPKEYMGFKSGYIVLLANIVLSVVIVYSCLLFSSAIKRCSWLAYVCFGERSSKA